MANYKIVTLGGPGRGGARHGHLIAIGSAAYDPATGTVTLNPVERLDIHNRYLLRVNMTATGGLTGANGGAFSEDFASVISRKTLVGSASRAFPGLPITGVVPSRSVRLTPWPHLKTSMDRRLRPDLPA